MAEMQPPPACGQPLHQLAHMVGPVRHRPPVADLAATPCPRNRTRNRRRMDIQPDGQAILHPVSPPFPRPGASPPGAPLDRRLPRPWPPPKPPHTPIIGARGRLSATTPPEMAQWSGQQGPRAVGRRSAMALRRVACSSGRQDQTCGGWSIEVMRGARAIRVRWTAPGGIGARVRRWIVGTRRSFGHWRCRGHAPGVRRHGPRGGRVPRGWRGLRAGRRGAARWSGGERRSRRPRWRRGPRCRRPDRLVGHRPVALQCRERLADARAGGAEDLGQFLFLRPHDRGVS